MQDRELCIRIVVGCMNASIKNTKVRYGVPMDVYIHNKQDVMGPYTIYL